MKIQQGHTAQGLEAFKYKTIPFGSSGTFETDRFSILWQSPEDAAVIPYVSYAQEVLEQAQVRVA